MMNEFKHSKHKNIGIIFELLSRQVVSDILSNKKSSAINIIRRNFTKDSEISKELTLYKNIVEFQKKEKSTASKFLDIILEQRKSLDALKLKREKYKLLGEIKAAYTGGDFFNSRINNYKILASIYQIFENQAATNPTKYIDCYEIIIESIIKQPITETEESKSVKIWESQPEEIKQLAFSMIIEKFNEKYKNLIPKQRTLISKFINENPDTTEFKNYVINECVSIQIKLDKIHESLQDSALKIKLKEARQLLNNIVTAKFIKEEYLGAMLSYYELIKVLK